MQVSELEALKKRAMLLSQCIESERILLDNKLLELSTEKANAEEKVEQLERLLEEKQISIRELQLENQSLRDVSNYKPEKCTACGDVISDAELQLNAVLDQLLAAEARMRELEVSLAVEAGAAKVRGACIMLWARRGRHNVRQVVEARAAEETAARSKADAECDRLRELLVQARATQYSMAQALEAQCREAARLAEQDARKMTAALKSAGQAREAQVAAEARAEAAERRAAEAEQRVAVLERRGAAREEAEAAAKARLEHLNRALGLLQDRKIHELVLELQAEVRAADRRHQNCAERASVLAAELERSQAAQKSQAQMQREEAGRGVGELQRRAEAAERRAEALQARAAEAADQQARRGRSEVERVGEQLAAQRRRGDELEAALAVARRAHRDEASARSNETARLRALCDKQRLQLAAAEAAAARVAEIEAMRVAAAAAARRLQADEHQAQLVALEERLTRRAAAAEARIRQVRRLKHACLCLGGRCLAWGPHPLLGRSWTTPPPHLPPCSAVLSQPRSALRGARRKRAASGSRCAAVRKRNTRGSLQVP
mmetsp:Transcript_81021/g.217434  ORF Transcript_81021/g.217434 Transcript_81021/m.217434 type:complete len:550 (+) Transcript_81021:820-2469(+)